ncbi:MAG: hypothetical protein L3J53_02580 [Proteobacteria bacterium]|nr:hypothetical protein [Pseudomonadota bacterium]
MKLRKIFITAITALVLTSCASTSTKMTGTWKAPDFKTKNFNNILVLSIAQDGVDRRMFEDAMAKALTKAGAESIPSYRVLPNGGKLNEDTVTEVVKKHKYDGVIVTKLITVTTDIEHVGAKSYTQPTGFYQTGYPTGYYRSGYNGFYAPGYYNNYAISYERINEPAYNIETTTAVVETNLYDTETQNLVWSGRSATINPLSAGNAIPSITSAIAKQLKAEKVIGN